LPAQNGNDEAAIGEYKLFQCARITRQQPCDEMRFFLQFHRWIWSAKDGPNEVAEKKCGPAYRRTISRDFATIDVEFSATFLKYRES
jgi:hypothetical protein